MSIWDVASAAIDATFSDEELLVYTGAGLTAAPLQAIWSEFPALEFAGAGSTLKSIVYELPYADLPQKPRGEVDFFTHRGRKWRVINVDRSDPVQKWQLTVRDEGPAA